MIKTHRKTLRLVCIALILLVGVFGAACSDGEDEEKPVVHAVLFYSPNCPHCHTVITEVLPPLQEKYGDQLQIGGADTSTPEGHALYNAAIEHFQIPGDRHGVPTLIIGDVVLVGGLEIPEQLTGLVEEGLAAGGVGWPAIPGLTPPAPPASE
jgi:thiol-disulfide isomerase/thioredoxin